VRLSHSLVKRLALRSRNVELELGGLAGAVAGGEGSCAPGGAAVDFVEVGELGLGGVSGLLPAWFGEWMRDLPKVVLYPRGT
jgi:hypothetical protein